MRSFGFKTQYLQVMQQSTRNQVPITKQREFCHVIPPLEQQQQIVGELDCLLENGQRLESIYQRKLAALEALKKSLLHQAFTGNTVGALPSMNEAETRAEHIDPALKAAGWGVVEGSRIRREYPITLGRIEGHGRRGKPLTADYVLVYRNTNWPSSRPRRGMKR